MVPISPPDLEAGGPGWGVAVHSQAVGGMDPW